MSGKGGVGKSTICVGIAQTISKFKNTCVIDFDVSTPSVSFLMNVESECVVVNERIICNESVDCDSISDRDCDCLVDSKEDGYDESKDDNEINKDSKDDSTNNIKDNIKDYKDNRNEKTNHLKILTTPNSTTTSSKTRSIQNLLSNSDLTGITCLIFDLPPNISDEHLCLVNYVTDLKVILVTIPNKISVDDVVRQIDFCRKAKLCILGLVCNMDGFVCRCGHLNVLGDFDVKKFCEENGVLYLGSVRLEMEIGKKGDCGVVESNLVFEEIVRNIIVECGV
jgi:Mrp family chromosome partitioning ATPase